MDLQGAASRDKAQAGVAGLDWQGRLCEVSRVEARISLDGIGAASQEWRDPARAV